MCTLPPPKKADFGGGSLKSKNIFFLDVVWAWFDVRCKAWIWADLLSPLITYVAQIFFSLACHEVWTSFKKSCFCELVRNFEVDFWLQTQKNLIFLLFLQMMCKDHKNMKRHPKAYWNSFSCFFLSHGELKCKKFETKLHT